MSLVFAGMTPHPPILIPTIGKDQLSVIHNTKQAIERLEEELYIVKPHVIIIISPHSGIFADSFSINAHTRFIASFEKFGDLSTKLHWPGAPEIAAKISHRAKVAQVPVQLVSQEALDHGASVALTYLTAHLPDVKILPIGYSELSPEEHIRFGELLKETIMQDDRRIAVIASGDLSHCITKDGPAGYRPSGKKFDDRFIELLTANDTAALAALDPALIADAEECGYRSALILLGILQHFDYTFKKYSYECPFGVGYLVGQFAF